MPRIPAPSCAVCANLYEATRPGQPGYVSLPRIGDAGSVPMRRIYSRPESKAYEGMGWICPVGHVTLDGQTDYGNGHHSGHHLITPTIPRKVICLMSGETVNTDCATEEAQKPP